MHNSLADLAVRTLAGVIGLGSLLAAVTYVPGFGATVGIVLVVVLTATLVLTVVVSVAVAVELPPPRPLSEVSILGKHVVGLSKLVIALLAFFGNTALTWFIALSVARQDVVPIDTSTIEEELWRLFVVLLGPIAFFFWMWIAFDLTRTERARRREAVDVLAERWSIKVGLWPGFSRLVRGCARWLVSGPWWQTVMSFYLAPLFLIAVVTTVLADL